MSRRAHYDNNEKKKDCKKKVTCEKINLAAHGGVKPPRIIAGEEIKACLAGVMKKIAVGIGGDAEYGVFRDDKTRKYEFGGGRVV